MMHVSKAEFIGGKEADDAYSKLCELTGLEWDVKRTCRNDNGYCGQCGTQLVSFFKRYTEEDGFTWGFKPYCAGCGAKVVSE